LRPLTGGLIALTSGLIALKSGWTDELETHGS
jgi:hypothetical protein